MLPENVKRTSVEVDAHKGDAFDHHIFQSGLQFLDRDVVLIHADSDVFRRCADVFCQGILKTSSQRDLKCILEREQLLTKLKIGITLVNVLLALMTFGSKPGNSALASGEQE